jgi:UTP--glucose-1-phosphate uridylyltransferase
MRSEPKVAVITAAGSATRMWPASKVVPKELFPLGRVPALVRIVWEMLDANIEQIILVVTDQSHALVRALFDSRVPVPPNVRGDAEVERFQAALETADIRFVQQTGPYGNGTPLLNAADSIGDVSCIYAFGDDVVFGENATSGLIRIYNETNVPVLAAQNVELSRIGAFGVLECVERNGIQFVRRLVEKPKKGETLSTLASFGRYLVTPDLLRQLRETPLGKNDELWLVDAIVQRLRAGHEVCALPLTEGHWHTVGDPRGYADAVRAAMSS